MAAVKISNPYTATFLSMRMYFQTYLSLVSGYRWLSESLDSLQSGHKVISVELADVDEVELWYVRPYSSPPLLVQRTHLVIGYDLSLPVGLAAHLRLPLRRIVDLRLLESSS